MALQLPGWTAGVVLQSKGTAQTIINDLKADLFQVGVLEVGGVGQAKIEFSYANDPAINNITFGPDLTFPNCSIQSSIKIGSVVQERDLQVTNKITTSNLLVNAIDLGVQTQAFGSKTNPEENPINTYQMASQNKIFFQYTDSEDPETIVTIVNQLIPTAMIFVKDITGTRDIPGVVVQAFVEGQNPFVNISRIPADPDGYGRAMVLFL